MNTGLHLCICWTLSANQHSNAWWTKHRCQKYATDAL